MIETKTQELYISERNAGDEDYNLTVLLPCLVGKFDQREKTLSRSIAGFVYRYVLPFSVAVLLCIVMLCLCCTRIDNPLCQFCSRTYIPV